MKGQAHQGEAGHISRVAVALMRLCGIGLIGAWVLASEIYGWREFRNRKEVGSVPGLTPAPYSSGNGQHEQGISKAGNQRARSLLGAGVAVVAISAGFHLEPMVPGSL
jgi:transposase